MNGLMVAFALGLPYHVLRTAAAAGVRVHVLGDGASSALRGSVHCASYRRLGCAATAENAERIADEIAALVRRHRVDVIFPGDDVSTRLLAGLQGRLPVRTSPLPDLATFDLLNDKWNFTRYCRDHGVRVPQAWCFDSVDGLHAALDRGTLDLPLTIKPTNRSGSVGVMHIRDESERRSIGSIDYAPILVQRHIRGESVCLSALCRGGAIVAQVCQRRDERRFQLFDCPDLAANAARVVAATRLDGPVNFDAVIEDDTGLSYIVECNPRFWYTIYLSMLVGFNFMAPTLADPCIAAVPRAAPLTSEVLELSVRHTLTHWAGATAIDRALARYHLLDPIPYLLCRTKWVDDSDVAVRVDEMSAYRWPGVPAALPKIA